MPTDTATQAPIPHPYVYHKEQQRIHMSKLTTEERDAKILQGISEYVRERWPCYQVSMDRVSVTLRCTACGQAMRFPRPLRGPKILHRGMLCECGTRSAFTRDEEIRSSPQARSIRAAIHDLSALTGLSTGHLFQLLT